MSDQHPTRSYPHRRAREPRARRIPKKLRHIPAQHFITMRLEQHAAPVSSNSVSHSPTPSPSPSPSPSPTDQSQFGSETSSVHTFSGQDDDFWQPATSSQTYACCQEDNLTMPTHVRSQNDGENIEPIAIPAQSYNYSLFPYPMNTSASAPAPASANEDRAHHQYRTVDAGISAYDHPHVSPWLGQEVPQMPDEAHHTAFDRTFTTQESQPMSNDYANWPFDTATDQPGNSGRFLMTYQSSDT